MAPRISRDRKVSRQARAVSVVSGNVRWCSGIEGLDVNENKRVGPIIVMKDDVGRVLGACEMGLLCIHWSTAR